VCVCVCVRVRVCVRVCVCETYLCRFGDTGALSSNKVQWQHHERTEVKCVCVCVCVLLERLGQVEALLHVVVVGRRGVHVSDAAVASFYFTVLLQSLRGGSEEDINHTLHAFKTSLNLRADVCEI